MISRSIRRQILFGANTIVMIKDKLAFPIEQVNFLTLCSNNTLVEGAGILNEAANFIEETGRPLAKYAL